MRRRCLVPHDLLEIIDSLHHQFAYAWPPSIALGNGKTRLIKLHQFDNFYIVHVILITRSSIHGLLCSLVFHVANDKTRLHVWNKCSALCMRSTGKMSGVFRLPSNCLRTHVLFITYCTASVLYAVFRGSSDGNQSAPRSLEKKASIESAILGYHDELAETAKCRLLGNVPRQRARFRNKDALERYVVDRTSI